MSEPCRTCHGSEYIDNGCGVVPCPDCSVTATSFRLALDAERARQADSVGLREAAQAVVDSHHGVATGVVSGPPHKDEDFTYYVSGVALQRLAVVLASLPAQAVEPDNEAVHRAWTAHLMDGIHYCPLCVADHAAQAVEPGPLDTLLQALRDFMSERMDEPHEMTPGEERLMKAARAALSPDKQPKEAG